MATEQEITAGWQVQQRPALMTRRLEFASYKETRAFLDQLTALSERTGYFPDLNFGKTHINITIAAYETALNEVQIAYAAQVNALAGQTTE